MIDINISDHHLEIIENSLIIYPNPSSENISILFNRTDTAQINVELYNLNGELIDIIYKGINKREINYNFNYVARGIYIIKIKTDENIFIRKVIINN